MAKTYSIQIETSLYDGGRIVQETSHTINGSRDLMARKVLDLREDQVRAALIALGWTPPDASRIPETMRTLE